MNALSSIACSPFIIRFYNNCADISHTDIRIQIGRGAYIHFHKQHAQWKHKFALGGIQTRDRCRKQIHKRQT